MTAAELTIYPNLLLLHLICESANSEVTLKVEMFIHLSVFVAHPYFHPSVCPFVHPSVCLFVHPSVCPFVHPSVLRLSVGSRMRETSISRLLFNIDGLNFE